MEMLEEEMSKAVLEVIDAKLSPISERLNKIEKSIEIHEEIYVSKTDLELIRGLLMELKADVNKEFLVTAKLIESVMDAVEKTSSAKKCEADIKGIQLLKGELKEQ